MATTVETTPASATTETKITKNTRPRCIETKSIRDVINKLSERNVSSFKSTPEYKAYVQSDACKRDIAEAIESKLPKKMDRFKANNPTASDADIVKAKHTFVAEITASIQERKHRFHMAKQVSDVLEDWIEQNMDNIRTLQPMSKAPETVLSEMSEAGELRLKDSYFSSHGKKGERKYKKQDDKKHLEILMRFVIIRATHNAMLHKRLTINQNDIKTVLDNVTPFVFQSERDIEAPKESTEAMETTPAPVVEKPKPVKKTGAGKRKRSAESEAVAEPVPKKRAPAAKKTKATETPAPPTPAKATPKKTGAGKRVAKSKA